VPELRISDALALPIEAATETLAILAKKGAGKTYTASVFTEELIGAKVQTVVIDPMSAWWGSVPASTGTPAASR
jgi:hypothetical protein